MRIARANLLANKTRSFLSVMGLVIGIAAATVVAAIANGVRLSVLESLSSMGTQVLYLFPNFETARGGERVQQLTHEGLVRLAELPFVEAAFPQMSYSGAARGALNELRLDAMGIYPRYLEVYRIPVVEGRGFNDRDLEVKARICLLEVQTAQKLYGAAGALGKMLRFGRTSYEVVGLVKRSSVPLGFGNGVETSLYIPLPTLFRQEASMIGSMGSAEIWIKKDYKGDPKEDILVAAAGNPQRKALFMIQDPKALIEEMQKTSGRLQRTMLMLAGISLLVGGIGIMNVMLISVAERTREIGLRKAIGASSRDILLQFLVEVLLLSGLGGAGGVGAGVLAVWLTPQLSSGDVPMAIVPSAIFVALAFSVVVGGIFGLYPAFSASRLSPLEALRHE